MGFGFIVCVWVLCSLVLFGLVLRFFVVCCLLVFDYVVLPVTVCFGCAWFVLVDNLVIVVFVFVCWVL